MKKSYLIIFISLFSIALNADQSLPINSIIELDEATYLVNMAKEDDGSVTYRTYPFGAINQAGYYKLANTVSSAISINASNVTLDLSGQLVTGGISVGSGLNNVQIKDGIIDTNATNGINIQSNCQDINIEKVIVKNATIGINGDQVTGALINNCEMTSNGTGLALYQSNNIVVQNCKAIKNTHEGFCLQQSAKCTIKNCNALSTGDGNSETSNIAIMGFNATNGSKNVFDECCSQSTQALNVTDSNSLVAGFALRGSENGSLIINSNSANTQTNPNSFTKPIGILLQESINSSFEITDSDSASSTRTVSWSPDGNYFASASYSDNAFRIYALDRKTELLTRVVDQFEDGPTAVVWSPDGAYVAVGIFNNNQLKIYAFDNITESISLVVLRDVGNTINTGISWSPDGNYLAVSVTGADKVDIYSFNKVAQSITFLNSAGSGGMVTGGNSPLGVQWSPSGDYLAIAFSNSNLVYLYSFNRSTGTLAVVTNTSGTFPYAVSWSPDGKYLAVAFTTSNTVRVLSFNGTSLSSVAVASSSTGCRSVSWSSDGKYLAVAYSSNTVNIYRFNSFAGSLTLAAHNGSVTAPYWVDWSPDGAYISVAADTTINVCRALTFPAQNVVQNNIIYCNSGGSIPSGIGISGSSIENQIIQNTVYASPLDPFSVFTPYAFCTNVYNPLFQDYPQPNQNIGPAALQPIAAPADQVAMLNQLNSKLCDIQTKLDLLIAANS